MAAPTRHVNDASLRNLKTVSLYLSFIGVGLMAALVGPSLPLLQSHYGTTTSTMASTLTGGGVGYLCGSFLCGRLLDRFPPMFILSVANLFSGLLTIVAPYSFNVYCYLFTITLQNFFISHMDTGCNTYIIVLWETSRLKDPLMQGLNCIFSFGATISPLVLKMALSALGPSESTHAVRRAYFTVGAYVTLVGALCFMVHLRSGMHDLINSQDELSAPQPLSATRKRLYRLVFLFIFCFAMVESNLGGFLATHAKEVLHWNEQEGATLTSLFWASHTFGRAISVLTSSRYGPAQLLLVHLSLTLCGVSILLFIPALTRPAVTLTAIGLSAVFTSLFLLLSQKVRITGKEGSLVLTGASLGAITFPILIAIFLPIVKLAVPLLALTSCCALLYLRRQVERIQISPELV